jgi:hypothetical protein
MFERLDGRPLSEAEVEEIEAQFKKTDLEVISTDRRAALKIIQLATSAYASPPDEDGSYTATITLPGPDEEGA